MALQCQPQIGCEPYNDTMNSSPDLIVIGGGIIGLTSAYVLANAGVQVAVYDRQDFGREASWAGAGIIPPGDPLRAATPYDHLRALGAVGMPILSSELRELTGIDNGYLRSGGIDFLQVADDYVVPLWQQEAIRYEALSVSQLASREANIASPVGSPYYLPDMAQVRNPRHLRALIAGCERIGVELHASCGLERFLVDGDRITGVQLSTGEVASAGQYLLATGAWSGAILQAFGCTPGVVPVLGQIALLQTNADVLKSILLFGKEYLVPRGDGRILIGSTEEPEAGFAKRTTPEGIESLLAFANHLVPALRDAKLETAWCGLRPGSPDGMPFIGPVPNVRNLFAAIGHYRSGVQLSIGTAQFVKELVMGEVPCVPLSSFALDRKAGRMGRTAFRS